MLTIAGGILLAVLVLVFLPVLFRGAAVVGAAVLLVLAAGALALVVWAIGAQTIVTILLYAGAIAGGGYGLIKAGEAAQRYRNERLYKKYPFFRPWK